MYDTFGDGKRGTKMDVFRMSNLTPASLGCDAAHSSNFVAEVQSNSSCTRHVIFKSLMSSCLQNQLIHITKTRCCPQSVNFLH